MFDYMSNVAKHHFTSAKIDDPDTTLVRPTNWNHEHIFNGGSDGFLLTRDTDQSDGVSWLEPPVINVMAPPYLALGDGVTNDTAAIQAALVDALSTKGTLYFPARPVGYVVNGTFVLTGPIRVQGGGPKTLITQTGSVPTFKISPSVGGGTQAFIIEDFQITGGTIALDFSGPGNTALARQSHFRNIYCKNQTDKGISITNTGIINVAFDNIEVEGAANYGIFIQVTSETAATTNQSSWRNIRIASTQHATNAAFHMENTSNVAFATISFYTLTLEANEGAGLYTRHTKTRVYEGWFETNGRTSGAPDIFMDGSGALTCELDLYSPYFSSSHASQAGQRIFINSNNQRLVFINSRLQALTDTVDVDSHTNVRVVMIGNITRLPLLVNSTVPIIRLDADAWCTANSHPLTHHFSGTASPVFGTLLAGTGDVFTITVTGAALGDTVSLSPLGDPDTGTNSLMWMAVVTGTDTVQARVHNFTAVSIATIDREWRADVWRNG